MFRISSGIYGPMSTKLGRNVIARSKIAAGALVSIATNLLPWQPKKKIIFQAQPGLKLAPNIARVSRMSLGGTLG